MERPQGGGRLTIDRTNDLYTGTRTDDIQRLRRAVIFRDLEVDDLCALAAVAEPHCYDAGQLIEGVRSGEDALFVVTAGSVRLYLLSTEGKELTIGSRGQGEIFALRDIDTEPVDGAMAQASVDGATIFAVPWSHFLEILAFRPGAATSLASLLHKGLMQERRLMKELAFYNMRSRLAHKLAELAEADPGRIVSVPREELAAMVGTRPEEVSRALRHFLEERLIVYRPHGRVIGISNIEALASY